MATLLYSHDANGTRLSGDKEVLIAAALAGERIRVKNGSAADGWAIREYSNVYVRNNHVFTQGMQFSGNWAGDGLGFVFDPQTVYYLMSFSSSGRCQIRTFNLHTHTITDDRQVQFGLSWYVCG